MTFLLFQVPVVSTTCEMCGRLFVFRRVYREGMRLERSPRFDNNEHNLTVLNTPFADTAVYANKAHCTDNYAYFLSHTTLYTRQYSCASTLRKYSASWISSETIKCSNKSNIQLSFNKKKITDIFSCAPLDDSLDVSVI